MPIEEQWKSIKNFEGYYEVSSKGRVRNASGKILKTYRINSGYECLKLVKEGIRYSPLVHRLVATAFLENNSSLPEVNHIDCDKTNNSVENLEWCSGSRNKQHAIAAGRFARIFTMKNTLGIKHMKNPSSKYHNVCYDKSRGQWIACIRNNKRNIENKRFKTEIEAALYVNTLIDKYGLTDRTKNIV